MNWLKIIKEIVSHLGDKLDAIANRDSIGVEIKGVELITLKGDQGETGNTGKDSIVPGPRGERGERGEQGKGERGDRSIVPGTRGEKGLSGKDSTIQGPQGPKGPPGKDSKVRGPKGEPGNDGSPDIGEEIITKINKDKSDKIIRKEKIEGFADIESMVRTAEANSRWRGGGSFVYDYDYSSLLDGVTTTFTLPANAQIIALFGSSDYGYFKKTTDYTFTASVFTFTSQVNAATQLAQPQTLLLLYKIL